MNFPVLLGIIRNIICWGFFFTGIYFYTVENYYAIGHYISNSKDKNILNKNTGSIHSFENKLHIPYKNTFQQAFFTNIISDFGIKVLNKSPEQNRYYPHYSNSEPGESASIIQSIKIGRDSLINYSVIAKISPLVIPHSYNSLRINFKSSTEAGETEIYVRCFLEGFEKQLPNWKKIRYIEYSHLPPGNYRLIIEAKNSQKQLFESSALSFRVNAPFYLSWYAFIFYSLILIFILVIVLKWRTYRFMQEKIKLEQIINERTEDLRWEKEKAEHLLSNVLPHDSTSEFKRRGKAATQKYDLVTVLFSDIEGFTKIAEQMNPDVLIDQLDTFYFHFDAVVEKYNIEKIKTIGDAYMCAGGIPDKNSTNPVEVILAALEMTYYMQNLKKENADIWDLRIGIHTGPLIAGVIGSKKLSYDIWGDTVNTASRMESSGVPGKINISGNTYELVKDYFICDYRGKMPVKYKGEIDMYFVKGIRPELSVDLHRIPNKKFYIQLQLLRLKDLEGYIINKLDAELPKNIYFHNVKHALDVCTQVELIGKAEGLNGEDILLLRTAALMHDIGYILGYPDREKHSIAMSKEILPSYNYSSHQINEICKLILSTNKADARKNILEKVFIDANFAYLGRADYMQSIKALFQEFKDQGRQSKPGRWENTFLDRMEKYDFYTDTSKKLRETSKSDVLNFIKSLVEKNNF